MYAYQRNSGANTWDDRLMISPHYFFEQLRENDIGFFSGVPDSLLKDICAYISENTSSDEHVIAANEGAAIGLAIGNYLSTGSVPLVYMQNSGLGNIVNPLLSLADKEVYSIPMLLLIGWRGEPGVVDEPQHVKQGRVTTAMLDAMEIDYHVIDRSTSNVGDLIHDAVSQARQSGQPVALLVRKNMFEKYNAEKTNNGLSLTREVAIQSVVDLVRDDSIFVSTTGMASRELYEYRMQRNETHEKDFLTVGGMGHASMIALGIAMSKDSQPVVCIDGDGAALMHLGSLAIIADSKADNFIHIMINNGAHDSVGGQPTVGLSVDFPTVVRGLGYRQFYCVDNEQDLAEVFSKMGGCSGPAFIEIKVNKGNRADLGRPKTTPVENKEAFMRYVDL